MPLVVANTSPLRFLIEIGYERVLPALFQKIWIPGAVARELHQERTPPPVRHWAEHVPSWVEVREIDSSRFDDESSGIDRGEWEALELAKEIRANLLLMDDRAAVLVAREQGFTVTGTLGVLVDAARSNLIEIGPALERLSETKFRRTPDLFSQAEELAHCKRNTPKGDE